MAKESIVHNRFRRCMPMLELTRGDITRKTPEELRRLGIVLNGRLLSEMRDAMDMRDVTDAYDVPVSSITAQSIAVPVQFLQTILPGLVKVATAARKIDNLTGMSTVGSWEDEEIILTVLEQTGKARPYSDYGNVPKASWNLNFERRTVVAFEEGFSVGKREAARSARVNVDSATNKRNAAADALEISRNMVGFYGYNDGTNRTFGFLNDPNLPAYINLPAGASGSTKFADKDFAEITSDLRLLASLARINSKERVDPSKDRMVLALATSAREALTTMNPTASMSVNGWIKESFPNWTIESAPELDDANGGDSVVYLYPETINDGSTDNGVVLDQLVVTKFIALGVENRSKEYLEDFSNATAGMLCKRGFAIIRASGV